MKRLFLVVIPLSALVLVGLIVAIALLGTPDPGPRSDRNPAFVLYAGAGWALVMFGIGCGLALWGSSVTSRLKAVRGANPHALVVAAQRLPAIEKELGAITGSRVGSLPSLLVVGVGSSDITFWGRDIERPVALIPRDAVREVSVEMVRNGRPMPAIVLHVENAAGENGRVGFVPCREGWELWAILDRARTLELARSFGPVPDGPSR